MHLPEIKSASKQGKSDERREKQRNAIEQIERLNRNTCHEAEKRQAWQICVSDYYDRMKEAATNKDGKKSSNFVMDKKSRDRKLKEDIEALTVLDKKKNDKD